MTAKIQFRLRICKGQAIAVGPGKVALLEAIIEMGSISAAAKHMGMSYSRAWALVDEMNRCMRVTVVSTSAGGPAGGGTTVTPTGLELIKHYRTIERKAMAAAGSEIRAIVKLLIDD